MQPVQLNIIYEDIKLRSRGGRGHVYIHMPSPKREPLRRIRYGCRNSRGPSKVAIKCYNYRAIEYSYRLGYRLGRYYKVSIS